MDEDNWRLLFWVGPWTIVVSDGCLVVEVTVSRSTPERKKLLFSPGIKLLEPKPISNECMEYPATYTQNLANKFQYSENEK
jgi:hypothetical protein